MLLQCQHHDVKALPNGNILVIAWESKTNTGLRKGRNPNLVPTTVGEQIIEKSNLQELLRYHCENGIYGIIWFKILTHLKLVTETVAAASKLINLN
jgi:hypothetical protein